MYHLGEYTMVNFELKSINIWLKNEKKSFKHAGLSDIESNNLILIFLTIYKLFTVS